MAERARHGCAGEGAAAEGRVLLWGHSHAGNVLALVSNLLRADAAGVDRFFAAAAPFYRGRRAGDPARGRQA